VSSRGAPVRYVASMDLTPRLLDAPAAIDPDACWAASGAMALTGHADGPPLLVPASVADVLVRVAARFAVDTGVGVDGPALLGERAACTGWQRRGRTSVGGATRLLRAADGAWLAVALPRASDVELVPAWLGIDERALDADDPWPAVSAAVARRPASVVVADAVLLGLACAQLGETGPGPLAIARPHGAAPPVTDLRDVVVADLSALWAGPLCADLLGRSGADVVKVESVQRPDGARGGDASFHALLNAGKRSATVDLAGPAGRSELAALLAAADVVIESSRPRALEHLGIAAEDLLAHGGRTRVWCSITGHGRSGSAAHRVGFGDDAAVAGGLVAYDGDAPVFCADAAADPASGVVAAVAIVDRLAAGGRWLVDVALARTASFLAAGTTSATPWAGEVARPRARNPRSAS
jgi:hypothetical protein